MTILIKHLIMNNKTIIKITALFFITAFSHITLAQEGFPEPPQMKPEMTEFWVPQPIIITPVVASCYESISSPTDADILFDGKDLLKWKGVKAEQAEWIISDGVITVKKGVGDIETKKHYRDFQLHIEWKVPVSITGSSQSRGNSGVFLQGKYEVQILDNYNNKTYANGQAGSIYKQTPPLVNAMRKPGEWNVYEIIYTAPTFKEDGNYRTYPYVTVIHNSIVIQNNTRINGTTPYIGLPQVEAHADGPIRLQDHGNPVSFRDIWIREL